ncbi:META domain-containing protein [uncultured Phenylobacterium sp.]|uniref:META domain-containing protein n=1 Tax=uncultured Phenylobacterium sp. TaxID=349273 RepID=UPI0025D531EA|nr:META domain-containing protein [uncultured Phenylobacterium sp.]
MDDAQGRQAPAEPDRYTIVFGADGRATLRIDCNHGSGAWQATPSGAGGTLAFGPIATARMACPEPSMGPLLDRQLPYVRSYTFSSGRLHMSLMADGGIFTWEPHPEAGRETPGRSP